MSLLTREVKEDLKTEYIFRREIFYKVTYNILVRGIAYTKAWRHRREMQA